MRPPRTPRRTRTRALASALRTAGLAAALGGLVAVPRAPAAAQGTTAARAPMTDAQLFDRAYDAYGRREYPAAARLLQAYIARAPEPFRRHERFAASVRRAYDFARRAAADGRRPPPPPPDDDDSYGTSHSGIGVAPPRLERPPASPPAPPVRERIVRGPAGRLDAPAVDPTRCASGFVWREAVAGDRVCVTPESRARVADETRTAAERREPGGGAYGPNTCRSGFVWRAATPEDLVCVTPARRDEVAEENARAGARRMVP